MHEKLFWGLPYCVLSPDRWLTVFLSPLPLSLPAQRKRDLGQSAQPRLGKGTWRGELLSFPSPFMLASPECTQPEMQPDDPIMSKVINFSLVSASCLRFANSFQACLICILSSKFDCFCPLCCFILSPTSTFVSKKNNPGSNSPSSFFSTDLSNKQTTQPP